MDGEWERKDKQFALRPLSQNGKRLERGVTPVGADCLGVCTSAGGEGTPKGV